MDTYRSLTSLALHRIRQMVLSGELPPGMRIQIDALRRQLNIGASPVREALSILSSEQIVERQDQRGFRTADISVADFEMLLSTRCVVESLALRESIRDGDAAWESRVREARSALEAIDRQQEYDAWEQAHRAFHVALLSACRSTYLRQFCDQLLDLAVRYRNLALDESYPAEVSEREHRTLSEAALARDAEQACKLMDEHLRATSATMKKRIAEYVAKRDGTLETDAADAPLARNGRAAC
jgi:GntR family transcriptional regulator, carbon starvation induced regulator